MKKIMRGVLLFGMLGGMLMSCGNNSEGSKTGGEKQKLSLLRILLKDSEVLILDEPASALDTDSREQLYNYLNTIKRNSIIFIVTHDDKITDKVDHIINLSKNA